jgi:hypothetical protein
MSATPRQKPQKQPQAVSPQGGAQKPQRPSSGPLAKRTAWVRYATPLGSAEVTGARMVPVSLPAEPWRVE